MFIQVGLSLSKVVKATLIDYTSCFSSFGFDSYFEVSTFLIIKAINSSFDYYFEKAYLSLDYY